MTVADLAVQVAATAALGMANIPYCERIVGEEGSDSLDAGGKVMIEQLLELSSEALTVAGLDHAQLPP